MFAACGNTIRVYSLKTGMHFKTIRQTLRDGKVQDAHKNDILYLCLTRRSNPNKDLRLIAVDTKGILTEWDV